MVFQFIMWNVSDFGKIPSNPMKPSFSWWVFLWFSYGSSFGFPIVFLWFSYGIPMVFLWFSYGFLWFSYGFPLYNHHETSSCTSVLAFSRCSTCSTPSSMNHFSVAKARSCSSGNAVAKIMGYGYFQWENHGKIMEKNWKIIGKS